MCHLTYSEWPGRLLLPIGCSNLDLSMCDSESERNDIWKNSLVQLAIIGSKEFIQTTIAESVHGAISHVPRDEGYTAETKEHPPPVATLGTKQLLFRAYH